MKWLQEQVCRSCLMTFLSPLMSEHQTGGSKSISAFIFTSSGPFKGVISWCNSSWCLFHSAFIIFYYFSLALGLYFAIVQANLRYGMEGFIYVCAHTLLWDISLSTSWTGGSTTDCLMDWFNECISNEVAEAAAWRQFDKWTSRKQISPPVSDQWGKHRPQLLAGTR